RRASSCSCHEPRGGSLMALDVRADRAGQVVSARARRARYLPIAEHGMTGDLMDSLQLCNKHGLPIYHDGWFAVSDSLVYRYNVEASPDGLAGDEATFSLCSFWWVEALARAGRPEPGARSHREVRAVTQ